MTQFLTMDRIRQSNFFFDEMFDIITLGFETRVFLGVHAPFLLFLLMF